MLNLKETFGKRYRIGLDTSFEVEQYLGKTADLPWYYEIVGRNGSLYLHSETHLQLWISKIRIATRLEASLPQNWRVTQNTSDGYSFVFPAKDVAEALKWLKPRKRRLGSASPHLAKYQFKPREASHD